MTHDNNNNEIAIPKEIREFMPDGAHETVLGQRNGARKQYRYGNLHIREYDDKFLVHTDKVDPRRDPVGHLIVDAPEVLAGLVCAAVSNFVATEGGDEARKDVSGIEACYICYIRICRNIWLQKRSRTADSMPALRTPFQVLVKLTPSIISLRRDRRRWG